MTPDTPAPPSTAAGRALLYASVNRRRGAVEWTVSGDLVTAILAIEAEARLQATRLADSPFVKALSYPCNEPLHQQAKRNVDDRLARLAQDHSPEGSTDG